MKKYFVCSDIHGFYDEWMSALNQAGFDRNNPEHILIVDGDIFDRGSKPLQVYKFLISLPENRTILIRGNHEYLLMDLLETKIPTNREINNKTYQTLITLHKDPKKEQEKWLEENKNRYQNNALLQLNALKVLYKAERELYTNPTIQEIGRWLRSSHWRDYYELGQYIFVHSFIPLLGVEPFFQYFPEWRSEANGILWRIACWPCPYKLYEAGYFNEELKKGKILVCGHWPTSDFYNTLLYKDEPDKKLDVAKSNPIFRSDKYPGIIAIDATTAMTKKVNVLIINENELRY